METIEELKSDEIILKQGGGCQEYLQFISDIKLINFNKNAKHAKKTNGNEHKNLKGKH